MMKAVAVAALMALLTAPAFASDRTTRTARGEYNTIDLRVDPDPPAARGRFTNGVEFKVRPGERTVSFTIQDDAGLPVRAVAAQDLDRDRRNDVEHEFCGAIKKPIRVDPRAPVVVWVQEGPCADGRGAVSTFGTVTATFRR